MTRHANNAPGATCRSDPAHGPILLLDGAPYCPHSDHTDGRHPASGSPWQLTAPTSASDTGFQGALIPDADAGAIGTVSRNRVERAR